MANQMPSDFSGQRIPQAAQSPSAICTTIQNVPEDAGGNISISTSAIDYHCKEVDEARYAATRLSVDHPDWLHTSRTLVTLLLKHFEESNHIALLNECIDIQRQICAVYTTDHSDRADFVSDLASSLRTCFKQIGEDSLLAEAISLDREALSLRPEGHHSRSISCINLASSLWTRFQKTGEQDLLTEAIDLDREALSLRPRGHPDRSISCNSLAVSLQTRFDQTGEISLLTEAIELKREALLLRPNEHSERSKLCNNLAISLRACFNQTGEESLLAEAIELHREALSLRPSGHPDRFTSCHNLGNALWTRFSQTGDGSLLTEAINLHKEALSLQPCGHPQRSMSCSTLANSLWTRFNQTGDRSLLTEAIDLQKEALSLQPCGHPYRSMTCTNLAISLSTLFKQAEDKLLLIEAIALHREALALQPRGHPLRLSSCSELAASLKTLFELTGDESMLFEIIDIHKDIMKCQPQSHPRWWRFIIHLVHIYLNRRFSQHNVILAIDYLQQVLSLTSDDWSTLLSEVAQLTNLIDLPTLSQDFLSRLLHCLSATIDLASRVAGFVLDPESQLRYLRHSHHLGPRAYWCAVACGQPRLGLELLERARAMIWTQALHIRDPQLHGAPPELASELQLLLNRMNNSRAFNNMTSGVSSASHLLSSTEQDVRHRDGARIYQLIEQIRSIPGHEGFMRGLPCEELAQCASRQAVVVLIITEGECHALILHPDKQGPFALKLSGIFPDELMAMSTVASMAQGRDSGLDYAHDNYRGMKASHYQASSGQARSDLVLEKLWTTVVKPVIDYLQLQKASGSSRPRLHWCPTGAFMFLPLHAAGIYDTNKTDCCADYVVCSYTPTLTALLRAQKSNTSFYLHEAKLGLIAATKAWDKNLPALPNVEEEIRNVRAAAESASISVDGTKNSTGDQAIVTQVAQVFENTNIAHIACHGTHNAANALSSGFCLTDGNLSVSRLMDLNLKNAFFAFLSACETAKGDEKQPDQTIHLAAAMLFVGFRSVVATMWAMDDADGPQVAKLFYKRLFAEEVITLDAIPYALDYAVAELRKSGVPPHRWATFIHVGA